MEFDNKTILIIGLIAGGIIALYLNMENVASAIFGGLTGYLSKDVYDYTKQKIPTNDNELTNDENEI